MPDMGCYCATHNGNLSRGRHVNYGRCSGSEQELKYAELQQTHIFVPVSVETLGSWNCDSLNFISNIGKKLTEVTGDSIETTVACFNAFPLLSVELLLSMKICVLCSNHTIM